MVAKSEALLKNSKKSCWAWYSFSFLSCTTIKLEVDGYQSFNLFNWFLWFPLNCLFSVPWEIMRKLSLINTCSSAWKFWAGPQFEIKLSFLFYALPVLWVSNREKNQKAYFTLVSPQTHLYLSLLPPTNFKNHSLIGSWSLTCTVLKFYSFLTNPSSLLLWFSILRLVTLSYCRISSP